MDRLNAMRAFAAVADRGSFAEAARQLRLSPAAVTRAVAGLEGALGLSLLNRTTRSVRLTQRGAQYLERCKQILADIEDADRQARGDDAAPRGQLTVAAPLSFGRLHVLPVVNGMLRDYPDLAVRLMLSDRIVHLAEDGIDVAVRIGDPADSALMAIKLGEVRRILTASPDYIARRGLPDRPAALSRHDVITFEGIDATNEWQFGSISVRVEPRLIVNSADAAIDAAIAGIGITRTLSLPGASGGAAWRPAAGARGLCAGAGSDQHHLPVAALGIGKPHRLRQRRAALFHHPAHTIRRARGQ